MNTPDFHALRAHAHELFMTGVRAAEPGPALSKAWKQKPPPVPQRHGRNIVVAFGKAATAMAEQALKLLAGSHEKTSCLVVTNDENLRDVDGARVLASGHPVPDERGVRAAAEISNALRSAKASDVVIVLISGGGSALLPAPVPGLSLEDKSRATEVLLRGGLDIGQMNAVRQHLSQLKGGGMKRLARPAPVFAYILSDVPGDDLRVIASGPTADRLMTRAEVAQMLEDRELFDELPRSARDILTNNATISELQHTNDADSEGSPCVNTIIGGNRMSLDAIVKSAKAFPVSIARSDYSLDVETTCRLMLDDAAKLPRGTLRGLVFGGESHVDVRGDGLGGRNQELALRFAMGARDRNLEGDWAFLSGGSDGRDGPTDSAGAVVDPESLNRMLSRGIDPADSLARHDSYPALLASGDHVFTGGTGTNVADIQVFVRT